MVGGRASEAVCFRDGPARDDDGSRVGVDHGDPVAIVTTAGLHRPDDRPFGVGGGRAADFPGDYRVIPGDTDPGTLLMSHISVNFDRTGFQRDWNVVFPLDRLTELAAAGVIGSVAGYHYSFMGAAPPEQLEQPARRLAGLLRRDAVDAVLLVPV
jgi:D-proline reductase (dithiol) PrdB